MKHPNAETNRMISFSILEFLLWSARNVCTCFCYTNKLKINILILGRPCQKEAKPLKSHIGRLKMGARISTVNQLLILCLGIGKIQLYGTQTVGKDNSSSTQIQLSTNHIIFKKFVHQKRRVNK